MDDMDMIIKGQEVTRKLAMFLDKNDVTFLEACASFFSILSAQIDSEEQIAPLCKSLEKACYLSIKLQKLEDFNE